MTLGNNALTRVVSFKNAASRDDAFEIIVNSMQCRHIEMRDSNDDSIMHPYWIVCDLDEYKNVVTLLNDKNKKYDSSDFPNYGDVRQESYGI